MTIDSTTGVLVIGGGPVGLAAAIALGELGVATTLLERHTGTSRHPRRISMLLALTTCPRGWGVADEVRAAGLPADRNAGTAFCTRLVDPLLGAIVSRGADPARDAEIAGYGPELKVSCPQDVFEPLLKARAGAIDCVTVRFGAEVTSLQQSDDGARATWVDEAGDEHVVHASYVVAADGPRSPVRERLGIPLHGEERIGNQMGVYFHADLAPYVQDRPYLLWWVYNADASGVLIALDGRSRWTFNFAYDGGVEDPDDFTPERCVELMRAAVGDPGLEVDVRSARPWVMRAQIAERLRDGRVFLAGDAAHPLPPTGGQGMNTGISDVHNLAWKLAHVLAGDADPALLDTYEEERLPVATFNVEQSLRNARSMAEAGLGGMVRNDDDLIASLAALDDAGHASLRESIESQRDHFDYHGQIFNVTYRSSAILDDRPLPEVSIRDYTPVALPGARAPHAWLDRVRTSSLLDHFASGRFTLVTTAAGHARWASALASIRLVDVVAVDPAAAPEADRDVVGLYQLGTDGAVLVRPDGHVAARADRATDASVHGMREAFRVALGRPAPASVASIQ
jgi:putative polyketide hydroxylase